MLVILSGLSSSLFHHLLKNVEQQILSIVTEPHDVLQRPERERRERDSFLHTSIHTPHQSITGPLEVLTAL